MRGRLAGQRELDAAVAAERSRDAERMKRPEPVAELEQQLVVDREERSFERGEYRQLVVGPLDRGQRRANRLHLLAPVECLPADEQVRHPSRLDRVDVGPRHVVAEADEAAEEDGDVARLQRHAHLAPVGLLLAHRPRALFDEPRDVRADDVGQRRFDGLR